MGGCIPVRIFGLWWEGRRAEVGRRGVGGVWRDVRGDQGSGAVWLGMLGSCLGGRGVEVRRELLGAEEGRGGVECGNLMLFSPVLISPFENQGPLFTVSRNVEQSRVRISRARQGLGWCDIYIIMVIMGWKPGHAYEVLKLG